jgi:hypothetical protein
MKLLRVGQKGKEKPAALDKDGKIRDLSSHIKDLNPDHLNFETIKKLKVLIYLHYQNYLQVKELVLVLINQENL